MSVATELRTAIRLIGGPEDGQTIMGYKGEPPDLIVVFRTQMIAEGTLVACPEEGADQLPGDLLYRKTSRSELFDNPKFKGHPNVMAGCEFTFVRLVTDSDDPEFESGSPNP